MMECIPQNKATTSCCRCLKRHRSAARPPDQQDVRGPIDKGRVRGEAVLEPGEYADQRLIARQRLGVPARIGAETAVEQVEPAQRIDGEGLLHQGFEFSRREQMRWEIELLAVQQFDLEAIEIIVLPEGAGMVEGIDVSRRHRADGPHGGDEGARVTRASSSMTA